MTVRRPRAGDRGSVRAEMAAIDRERFERQQMHRHRVRGESVHDEQIGARGGFARQRQPRIAQHHRGVGLAFGEEVKAAGIARNRDHLGVDLVEAPTLVGPCVTGERPGAEANDPDAGMGE